MSLLFFTVFLLRIFLPLHGLGTALRLILLGLRGQTLCHALFLGLGLVCTLSGVERLLACAKRLEAFAVRLRGLLLAILDRKAL